MHGPEELPGQHEPDRHRAVQGEVLHPGDNVQYVINDNYREPNAPFFDAID